MPERNNDDATPFADRLVTDPKNPPELTMLQGWLGASSEDKHRRLYLDPELSQSLEIPEDAIVHTQDIPREVNPLGGSWVWTKADAAIKQGPGLERLYARFLRGQIQQDFFAAAAAGGGAGGLGGGMVGAPAPITNNPAVCPVRTLIGPCPTQQVWCRPSVLTICASQQIICPSRPIICQLTQPLQCQISAAIICQTRICPSAVDACPSAPGGCWDPTIFQQTVVQPGFQAGGIQGGLNFDPGMAAGGGFVGAPAQNTTRPCISELVVCGTPPPPTTTPQCQLVTAAGCQSQIVICHPSIIAQTCPTRSPICLSVPIIRCPTVIQQLCPTRFIHQCPTMPTTCPVINCPPSFPMLCPTTPGGVCPTVPPGCPTPSLPPGCPSGFVCPSGPVCDPAGGLMTVVNPADPTGGGGFDPTGGLGGGFGGGGFGGGGFAAGADVAGGMVGAPAGPNVVLQPTISPIICQPSLVIICRPTIIVQQCITQTPACWVTRWGCLTQVGCPTRFGCPTQFGCPTIGGCPTLGGCPSLACGGGGFPGGGGFGGF
jgi:hypothetical protein